MQLTLEIQSQTDLQLILQYIRLLPQVKVLKTPADDAEQAKFAGQLSKETEAVRAFASESDAFDFWENEDEDVYQDFLPAAPAA